MLIQQNTDDLKPSQEKIRAMLLYFLDKSVKRRIIDNHKKIKGVEKY